jgi:hypothetical protein
MAARILTMNTIHGLRRRAGAALLLTALAGHALAQEAAAEAGAAAPTRLEQRLHQEMQSVLLRLIEGGELDAAAASELSLAAPASQQPDFGAILDIRHRPGQTGLPVLGVTPGSSAAALGLQAGDVIVAVNSVALDGLGADAAGHSLAASRLRAELLADADAVELQVQRGGGPVTLQGPVRIVDLPAYRLELGAALAHASLAATGGGDGVSSCGRISVFDIAPRAQKLYPAVLIAIDDKLPGPTSSDVFRVAPGRHRLTVAEAIDWRQFSDLQRLQRDRGMRDRYKVIEVDVQPGITYRLAARFHYEERHSIRDGAYWEPVIWKESPEHCR